MKKAFLFMTCIGCVLMFAFSSFSEDVPPGVLKKGVETQKEQQLELERHLEKMREKPGKEKPALEIAPPEPQKMPYSDRLWTFKKIEITGADLLDEKKKIDLTEKYVNRPLSFSQINDLLNDITLYYFHKGYITTKVYIPVDQNIAAGILKLAVVEGRIEEIVPADEKGRLNLFTAFPFLKGKVFNLRDIEQGLDQINRLRSNDAVMEILPGSREGYSRIIIKNKQKFPVSGSLTYDNAGSETSGRDRVSGSISIDNPLFLNDSLALSSNFSPLINNHSFKGSVPNLEDRTSRSWQVNYQIPFGYTTTSFGASQSDYSIPVHLQDGHTVYSEGSTVNINGTIDRLLYRDQTDKMNMFITLASKKSKNYFMQDLIDVASPKLVVCDFGLKYSTILYGGLINGEFVYSIGTKLFGATTDRPDQNDRLPTAQYKAVKLNVLYHKQFDGTGIKPLYVGNFVAQYTNDVLYGLEQIYIGGLYSVRGFHNVSESGDRGWYMQNTLYFNNDWNPVKSGSDKISVTPFIGCDVGKILSHNLSPSIMLAGMACGVDISYNQFKTTLTYMFPILTYNRTFNTRDNEHNRVLISISAQF